MDNIVGIVWKQDSVELPQASVDLVFICDTYHHFEFPQKTMHSIYAALKPNGQVVLIDYHRIPGVSSDWIMGHVRAGQEVFTQEIVDAGFKQIDEKTGLAQGVVLRTVREGRQINCPIEQPRRRFELRSTDWC